MPPIAKKEFMFTRFDMKSIGESTTEDSGQFAYFEGYAATFGNIDLVDDVIIKGAFAKCLSRKPKVKLLWQHDMREPIGSVVEMEEDAIGLKVKGRINLGTDCGRAAYALLKAGDLDSMSIGFRAVDWEYDSETDIRTIKEIDLIEISIVTRPANEMATVTQVKELLEEVDSLSDIENILKTKGFSNKEAKTFISKFKEIHTGRDVQKDAQTQRDVDVKKEDLDKLIQSMQGFVNQFKKDKK
jgi:HK97 family phage prohead protease